MKDSMLLLAVFLGGGIIIYAMQKIGKHFTIPDKVANKSVDVFYFIVGAVLLVVALGSVRLLFISIRYNNLIGTLFFGGVLWFLWMSYRSGKSE